ncbi:MAG: hypothetical protein HY786_00675 [Deltaproteobacteria bacterium]|nr:hypothetical protein [Deltaproteobacteria bacterium]
MEKGLSRMPIRPFLEFAVTEEIIESVEATGTTTAEAEEKEFSKADLLNRFLAKFIDFLIIGALGTAIKAPVGSMAALTYALIADGFFDGRSLGKKLIGLKVINLKTGMPCNRFFYSIPRLDTVLYSWAGCVTL